MVLWKQSEGYFIVIVGMNGFSLHMRYRLSQHDCTVSDVFYWPYIEYYNICIE